MSETPTVLLCPGQGAQSVGMGKGWFDSHPLSAQTLAAADETVELEINGARQRLSDLCFSGPEEHLNRTDVSQPALYACGVASYQGLLEERGTINVVGAAGLSLGEWTALHLAGTFGFIEGLRLVALRGRLMQEAAENSAGSMVALIGADEAQADEVCAEAVGSDVLVPANYNATGQIVISGSKAACLRAVGVAEKMSLRAKELSVAGAFHSPLMEPAAAGLEKALEEVTFESPSTLVWSNVTGLPHENDPASIKKKLVEQLTSPVRWSQCCSSMAERFQSTEEVQIQWDELAPSSVLRGLFRRIDRNVKVTTHDTPKETSKSTTDA